MMSQSSSSRRKGVGLTIGMAVYDDMQGLYFTIQALRMFHAEVMNQVEILVIDNNPTSRHGKISKDIVSKVRNGKYVPYSEKTSTSVREQVFKLAANDYVLCMDAHVLVRQGALRQLIAYYMENPNTNDLLQGPLWYDELEEGSIATHFQPKWGAHMYGQWATDVRGLAIDAPPIEIPMQGLGLFSCRKAAWPGFNPLFRGFGGEEGYIHEKFRQRGGKSLCLPFLRWVHCFHRLGAPPYTPILEDRFWNYIVGRNELQMPVDDVVDNFRGAIPESSIATLLAEADKLQPRNAPPSEEAKRLASILLALSSEHRTKALTHLKNTNPGLFASVRHHISEIWASFDA